MYSPKALQYEVCVFWQQRTGISPDTYRRAVRLREDVLCVYDGCQTQSLDISMVIFNTIQLTVLKLCI